MAKHTTHTDSKGTYIIVVSGDTLSGIASEFGTTTKQLAALNSDIKDVNKIYVNQKIYISTTGGSSSDSGSTPANSNKVTIKQFGLLSSSDNTLFATWDWSKSNQTESYKVLWAYKDGSGTVLVGDDSSIQVDSVTPTASRQSQYAIPNGALEVKFKVKPISKKKKVNGKETTYWTGEWTDFKIYKCETPLATPPVPDVEIVNNKLTATLDNINIDGADAIEFEVVKLDLSKSPAKKTKFIDNTPATIVDARASYSCYVDAGAEYQVRCRAIKNKKLYSEWSNYSDSYPSGPSTPTEITTIRYEAKTDSVDMVYLEWTKSATATSYIIQYTTNKEYFDLSDQVQEISVEADGQNDPPTSKLVTIQSGGEEYFFRVKAVRDGLESGWSGIASVVVGKAPVAPTTWSSTTTGVVGEDIILYWVHNSEDGSKQSSAELKIDINGTETIYTLADTTVDNNVILYNPLSDEDKEQGKTNSCRLFAPEEGAKIKWQVRTKGVIDEYSPWSIERTIDVYQQPTLYLAVTNKNGTMLDTVTSFPFYIEGDASGERQTPIGYHVVITSDEIYETLDNVGREKIVNAGEEVYYKYFDVFDGWSSPENLVIELTPGSIDLANNISYTVTCTVTMDSGLSATASIDFSVSWTEVDYDPNAEIGIDEESYTAYIRPYCESTSITRYLVTKISNSYRRETTRAVNVWGEELPGAKTTTGELVFEGVDSNGAEVYFCEVEEKTDITNVLLSVYRREFDGSFVELARDLDASERTTITDPHPSLDLARYRIVATAKDTGAITYYDVPGHPVGGIAAIIQWDESWTRFESSAEDELEQPAWSGSLLRLPYNIDVSDNTNPDVALVEYIGREHPVGYYGTQIGHTSSWSMEIEKADKETLYALRRLQRWMGNVYVREPSGSGYWANITVSFSQKHCEMTIPVTLSIVRVEGGV